MLLIPSLHLSPIVGGQCYKSMIVTGTRQQRYYASAVGVQNCNI